jgi:alpha-tubulin suppressor-like RCC1 family protein
MCWGQNDLGALGDGGNQSRQPTPVFVSRPDGGGPLTGVQSVALGSTFSCAVVEAGNVVCWGANGEGQLGDGTRAFHVLPAPVRGVGGGEPLGGARAVSLGRDHACAVMNDGSALCWGRNDEGQLGDGTTERRTTPVRVASGPGGPPLAGVRAISLGRAHSCALLESGEARCWGSNALGQAGDGTRESRSTPVPVLAAAGGAPLAGVTSLALGDFHSCALLSEGGLRCWGSNAAGQLGDGTRTDRELPTPVLSAPGGPPLAGARALSGGGLFSCALVGDDGARCWGFNGQGQLGDGTTESRSTPVPVVSAVGGAPLAPVRRLEAGGLSGCALLDGRDVRCWGLNASGQLGDGTTENRSTPVPVALAAGGAP